MAGCCEAKEKDACTIVNHYYCSCCGGGNGEGDGDLRERVEDLEEKVRELEEKIENCDCCDCGENPGTEVTIRLSETSRTLALPDGAFQLQAIVGPASLQDKSVTWRTSDPSIATVDQDGNVTAVGVGTATIIATTNVGGKSASCVVDIVNELPENNASKKRFLFEVGPCFQDETGGDCSAINEIEIYNATGGKISLSIPLSPAYDSITKGAPNYWNSPHGGWNYSKLTDGKWSYTSNMDGGGTTCLFVYGGKRPTDTDWARFVGSVDKSSIVEKIRLYAGGNEGRTPQYVKVWQILHDDVDRYVTEDRVIDNGLLPLATWTYEVQTTSGSYTDKAVQMV